MWTVVADAAENLGGGPVGLDALAALTPRCRRPWQTNSRAHGSDQQPGEPTTEEEASDA